MKKILLVSVLGLASTAALARGGNDEDRFPARGTQAWFVAESLEHSIRLLGAGTNIEQDLWSANVETAEGNATVTLQQSSGTATFSCVMVDESSRGGSVIKKDVNCVLN